MQREELRECKPDCARMHQLGESVLLKALGELGFDLGFDQWLCLGFCFGRCGRSIWRWGHIDVGSSTMDERMRVRTINHFLLMASQLCRAQPLAGCESMPSLMKRRLGVRACWMQSKRAGKNSASSRIACLISGNLKDEGHL